MNNLKRLLGCGLAAVMLMSATACDDGGSTSVGTSGVGGVGGTSGPAVTTPASTTAATTKDPNEQVATDEKVNEIETGNFTPSGNAGVVKYLGYFDINDDHKSAKTVAVFNSEQYGGEIQWISCPNGAAYFEQLGVLIAADDSPDLMLGEPLAFPYGITKNMFEPLDEYLDINDPVWADMKDVIDSKAYKGVHYYFPHRLTTDFALNYNKKTIQDAGLKDPYELYKNGEWTWDAWRQMMIDFCNQDDENIGFYGTDTVIDGFFMTTGLPLIGLNPDGSAQNNIASPEITKAVDYLAEMGRSGLLYPSSHPHGDWVSPQVWAPVSDKILFLGMEPEWTYQAATEEIQNQTGVDNDIFDTVSDFAFVPFPKAPDTDSYYQGIGTFGYMIAKGAKNINGAVEFIMCSRLYDTDPIVKEQVKQDHIAPEKVTYLEGKYAGMQKWVITWDEDVYDLWREMQDSSKFTFVSEGMYGFGTELQPALCTALYDSTMGEESWTQQRETISPVIEGILAEYAS